MGDMADMLYDQMADGGDWEREFGLECRDEDRPVTCRRCGKRNLWWHHTGARWRLINDDGNFHTCTQPASVDEFSDVS